MTKAEAKYLVRFLRRKINEGYAAPEEIMELEILEKALGPEVVESISE